MLPPSTPPPPCYFVKKLSCGSKSTASTKTLFLVSSGLQGWRVSRLRFCPVSRRARRLIACYGELSKTKRHSKSACSATRSRFSHRSIDYGSIIRSPIARSFASRSLIWRRRPGSSDSSSCARASRRSARSAYSSARAFEAYSVWCRSDFAPVGAKNQPNSKRRKTRRFETPDYSIGVACFHPSTPETGRFRRRICPQSSSHGTSC